MTATLTLGSNQKIFLFKNHYFLPHKQKVRKIFVTFRGLVGLQMGHKTTDRTMEPRLTTSLNCRKKWRTRIYIDIYYWNLYFHFFLIYIFSAISLTASKHKYTFLALSLNLTTVFTRPITTATGALAAFKTTPVAFSNP